MSIEAYEIRGWVISAGYGLIPVGALLKPYGATFTTGQMDSVRPMGAAWSDSEWWSALARWPGPVPGTPRSLTELGAAGEPILVAASSTYLNALRTDLETLLEHGVPGQVTLVSASAPPSLNRWKDSIVAFDSRVLGPLGGSRIGLNVRTLSYALETAQSPHADDMREVVCELMRRTPAVEQPERDRATDAEVDRFLREELTTNPEAKHTTLLRQWRTLGHACEQRRFRDLFSATRTSMNSNPQNSLPLGLTGS